MSTRNVTSVSRTATRRSKFPVRAASKNALTIRRWTVRSTFGTWLEPWILLRARLAHWARSVGRTVDHGADLVEGDSEHVVENEGDTLCWRQCVEHDHQRLANAVGDNGLSRRIGFGRVDERVGQMLIDGSVDAKSLSCPKHIEADAGDDRGQPASEIVDAAGVGAGKTKPCSCTASSASLIEPSIR